MRKCQLGDVSVAACQLETQQVLKVFSSMQYEEETSKDAQEDTIEGILMIVGEDIII